MRFSDRQDGSEGSPRVLMMDDQQIVCEAVRRVLQPYPEFTFLAVLEAELFFEAAVAFKPTVILLDLDLAVPQLSGLDLLQQVRACDELQDVPVVVLSVTEKAEIKQLAFELGANDYVVKLPETPELLARVRYHSQAYTNFIARKKAQSALNSELEEGRRYICSLFPEPLAKDGVCASWMFEACTKLAGDTFGYGWKGDAFLFGVHDVCGHGVASALHSVSVLNVLRSHSLVGVDFQDPSAVLRGLNDMFDMDRHCGLFFTMWYGVYHRATRQLRYACAGHPPAILIDPAQPGRPIRLSRGGMAIGIDATTHFETGTLTVPPGARLYLFSDGVYEVQRADGSGQLGYAAFEHHLSASRPEDCRPDVLAEWVRRQQGSEHFEDDFTLLEFGFE